MEPLTPYLSRCWGAEDKKGRVNLPPLFPRSFHAGSWKLEAGVSTRRQSLITCTNRSLTNCVQREWPYQSQASHRQTMKYSRPSSWPYWVRSHLLPRPTMKLELTQSSSYLSTRGADRLHLYPSLHICNGQGLSGRRRHQCLLLRRHPRLRIRRRRSLYGNDLGHDL